MTRPPEGSTGTLAELQVAPGDVVRVLGGREWEIVGIDENGEYLINDPPARHLSRTLLFTLISRANPDQPAHIITHEGRTYDLTALETPFGLLPEPVKEALKAWPHGVEHWRSDHWTSGHSLSFAGSFAYRGKPAPAETRVQCYRGEYGKPKEHGTCIKNPDGSINWASWEGDE